MTLLSWIFAACSIYLTNALIPTENINNISGAWMAKSGGANNLLVLQDGYLSLTKYDENAKKFFYAKGGRYTLDNNMLSLKCEFNSSNKEDVGKTFQYLLSIKDKELVLTEAGHTTTFKLIDNTSTDLTGCWRINGRMNNGEISEMKLAPRRTLKILTGNRFQWMAINIETGQFSATGGGTYTFKDGKYTEHIDFFSRDSSRVGASLSFNGEVKNGLWHHSGLSSKGDPIHETWERYR